MARPDAQVLERRVEMLQGFLSRDQNGEVAERTGDLRTRREWKSLSSELGADRDRAEKPRGNGRPRP